MQAVEPESPPHDLPPEELREALERILTSKYFINAHKKKKFLRVICDLYLEGRAHELNEHMVGYYVFDRDTGYNPSEDPIVRVTAHDIRKKLQAYYQNEGATERIRLELPAGSYQPVFVAGLPEERTSIPHEIISNSAKPEPEEPAVKVPLREIGIGIAVLFLVATVALWTWNRQLKQRVTELELAHSSSTFGELWAPFLADDDPPLVILSNPPILRFTNASDPEVLIKDSIPLPPDALKVLNDKFVMHPEVSIKESQGPTNDQTASAVVVERNRTPSLILSTSSYTGLGEAIGLHYLTDLFRRANRPIVLKQSRTISAEDLRKHNVIMLGGVWVNEWSSKFTRNEDFVFTNKATIENRHPQPGEELEYIPLFDRRTGGLTVDYALITVKPNISDNKQIMLLAGVYSQGTEAATEYVTNKTYLDYVNQRLQQRKTGANSRRYFQILLKVAVENGIPTTISTIALHELPSDT